MSVIAFMLLQTSFIATNAQAQDVDETPSPPEVHDLEGNEIDEIIIGHQVIVSKSFVNRMNITQPFIALFEIRDSDGVTVYFAWQIGTMASDQTNVGISWMADNFGVYEIRTFAISNFTNAEILDVVESKSISVVEDGSIKLVLKGKKFEVEPGSSKAKL